MYILGIYAYHGDAASIYDEGEFLMKRTIICTIFGVALLFVGLPLRASSTCSNPNSILNATYGWPRGCSLSQLIENRDYTH